MEANDDITSTDLFGLIALFMSGVVWMNVIRAFFIHSYNEAILWQILSNAFNLAPLAFTAALFASLWNIYRPTSSHLPEFALLTSLPTSGVWLAERLPDLLSQYANRTIDEKLIIVVVVFFIPAIFSALLLWLAKRTFLIHRSSRTR